MELTSTDAPSQFPAEGIDARQLPTGFLRSTGGKLGGAWAPTEIQGGLGLVGGRRGHQGIVGRGGAAGAGRGAGSEVQDASLAAAAHGGAEGELAQVDRGGGARRDGERRR